MTQGTRFKTLVPQDTVLNPNDPEDAVLNPADSGQVTVNGWPKAKTFTLTVTITTPKPNDPGDALNFRVTRCGSKP